MQIILAIVLILALDAYAFQAVKVFTEGFSPALANGIHISYWAVTILAIGTLLAAVFTNTNDWNKTVFTILRSVLFIFYFSKIIVIAFLLIDDARRLVAYVADSWSGNESFDPSRSKFLSNVGIMLGGLPLVTLTYGILRNAYRYKIFREDIFIDDLPEALEGFKMVQISDIHSGSFFLKEPIQNAVDMINKEEADVIFFTGDMVNSVASEMEPYMDIFSQLKSKYGVMSVRGNHDYGDYSRWESQEAKNENTTKFEQIQHAMGWDLLKNENRILNINGAELAVLGIENTSGLPQFQKYGDLERAYQGTENAPVKILLSHDPSYWEKGILTKYQDIDLTLSGHTHGFQFGIEIPGWIKWSPSKYMYKQWAGLYERNKQKLYVNRGFGFLGYPGRVGILPEITVLTLKRRNSTT
ncbi:MAG: metallophosphoesterase [Saprospiraceae bacterium]